MEDVASGSERRKIPLLPGAPSSALQILQESFEYITDWILPAGVQNTLFEAGADEDDGAGFACDCDEDLYCNGRSIECTCVIDYGHYYDSSSRLALDTLPARYALYECGSSCACTASGLCSNNITQRGVNTRCSVRWTANRGFGLFTEEDIPKGNFLCCYVGEVISTAETKKRWTKQKEEKLSNYTFILKECLEINGRQEIFKTAIDARVKGNIGHFLNHACPPLTTHIVLPVRTVGTLIPRPAFFAVRDIRKGEELTWDYEDASGETWLSSKTSARVSSDSGLASEARTLCLCGSTGCRKWLAYDPSL